MSQIRCTSRWSRTRSSILARNFLNSIARCRRCMLEITDPLAVLKAATGWSCRAGHSRGYASLGHPGIIENAQPRLQEAPICTERRARSAPRSSPWPTRSSSSDGYSAKHGPRTAGPPDHPADRKLSAESQSRDRLSAARTAAPTRQSKASAQSFRPTSGSVANSADGADTASVRAQAASAETSNGGHTALSSSTMTPGSSRPVREGPQRSARARGGV